MATCLVQKLMQAVNNGNLPKDGEIKVKVIDSSTFFLNWTLQLGYAVIRANGANLYRLDSSGNKEGEPFESGNVMSGSYNRGIAVADGYDQSVFLYNGNLIYNSKIVTLSGCETDLSMLTNIESIFLQKYREDKTRILAFPNLVHGLTVKGTHTGNQYLNFLCSTDEMNTVTEINGGDNGYFILNVSEWIRHHKKTSFFAMYKTKLIEMQSMADFGKLAYLGNITHINQYSWTIEKFVANKVSVTSTDRDTTSGTLTVRFGNDDSNGGVCSFNGTKLATVSETVKWRPTQTSIANAVTDVVIGTTAIAIDSNGNKVGNATPW